MLYFIDVLTLRADQLALHFLFLTLRSLFGLVDFHSEVVDHIVKLLQLRDLAFLVDLAMSGLLSQLH